jgi:Domain of unknown function (DUF6249)
MKKSFLVCLLSIALGLTAFGQTATPALAPSPQATVAAAAVGASPVVANVPATVSATPDDEDSIQTRVTRKLRHKWDIDISPAKTHVKRHHNNDDSDSINVDDDDFGAFMAIPIIGIIFTTLFGAPVMVVAAIMFFSYLKSRSLHRTVREMVAKGQEVPASLFAPPPVVKARSDLRRGVVLLMVGLGLMVFFGAVNDWEGGAWSLGVIPFVIGLGYLLVWKLEGRSRDKVPPLP